MEEDYIEAYIKRIQEAVIKSAADADAARLATLPANVVDAYHTLQRALEIKRQDPARSSEPSDAELKTHRLADFGLVTARTYLLYASDTGADVLARTVLKEDGGVEEAEAFGRSFYHDVIVPMTTRRTTPPPAPAGSSVGSREEESAEETGKTDIAPLEGQSNLYTRLMEVYCGQCPVSGYFADAWRLFPTPPLPEYLRIPHATLRKPQDQVSKARFDDLKASHILRWALKSESDATWELLQKFAGPDIDLSVYRNNIQATENAVLLSITPDYRFAELSMWLEPEEEAFHRTNLTDSFSCTVHSKDRDAEGSPERITFRNFYAESGRGLPGYDLPNPKLLRLHASLGRVLAASGMKELVEEFGSEREEVDDLKSKGRSPQDVASWGADVARALRSVDTRD